MKKFSGQFAVWKCERAGFRDYYYVRLVDYAVLMGTDDLSKHPPDSIALGRLPQLLAGHDPYLALATLNRTRVNGQVFARCLQSGPVLFPILELLC